MPMKASGEKAVLPSRRRIICAPGNEANLDVTHHITAAAHEGIILQRHYTHWHCSPSRRSFLTGRLPLHHHEVLSDEFTDDIDLRWTTIAQKLKQAGYTTHWFGKGVTRPHLPTSSHHLSTVVLCRFGADFRRQAEHLRAPHQHEYRLQLP